MIRVWLNLIKCSPKYSSKLISALIVNLKVGGVLIRDEDLFQRDISQLLNSDIRSNYVLIKQLLNLFPVYFSCSIRGGTGAASSEGPRPSRARRVRIGGVGAPPILTARRRERVLGPGDA